MIFQPQTESPGERRQPPMSVRWDQDENRRVVRVTGPLTAQDESQLQGAIVGLGNRHLVLDLSGVVEIDDVCLDSLAELWHRLPLEQVNLVVDPDSPAAHRIASIIPPQPAS